MSERFYTEEVDGELFILDRDHPRAFDTAALCVLLNNLEEAYDVYYKKN